MELRRLRIERGLSQEQLAGLSGVSRPTVHRLEHGQRKPYKSTVIKLARALEVRPEELAPDLFAEPEGSSAGGVELTTEIYERFRPYVRKLARRISRTSGDADDLEGAGFEGLLEACRKFRSDGGMAFESWAKYYVRNRMLDQARRLYKGQSYGLDSLPARFGGTVPDMGTLGDEED